MKLVYLGFGSNIGQRETMIADALRRLAGPGLQLRRVSSLYETEPVGLRDQRWFLNLAAEFETSLFPLQLLQRTRKVERSLGRVRTVPNGPRTIDIDILLYGRSVIQTRDLEVPHPRFRERRFVLAPLAELNPSLLDPVTGRTVSAMLADLSGQTVRPAGTLPEPLPGMPC